MNPIHGSLNYDSKSIDEAIEEVGLVFMVEEIIRKFFKEKEELNLERKRDVLSEKGSEQVVKERR